MPVFSYKASDQFGRRSAGSFTSDTIGSARELLRRKGLSPNELREARFEGSRTWRQSLDRGRRRERTSEFARQLSMLLRSGVPLAEGVDVLIRQAKGRFRTVLQDVRDRIAAGATFHDALVPHGAWFDLYFRSAVNVGQGSGRLEFSLRALADFENDRAVMRTRLLTALSYPGILCVLGVAVVLFLMTFVVPQLMTVLEENGQTLPAPTRILKELSDALTGHWGKLLAVIVMTAVMFSAIFKTKRGLKWIHGIQLRMPLIGILIRKTIVSQFAQAMAMLLQNGVTFLEALRLARTGTHHAVLAEELCGIEDAIRRGSDIAPVLEGSRVFPEMVTHMVHVGQKSGELPEILQQIKDGYETEVRLAIGKFAAAIEPILIIILSTVVGFIVLAIMLPILETTRSIR